MRTFMLSLFAVAVLAPSARADEGMWLFNNLPEADGEGEVQASTLTDEWLDHVRLSSVRFNSGGSGSFVSPDGLVMTNHHVGADCSSKLAHASDKDYIRDGFYAKTQAEEIKCPDLELNVLIDIEDVTERRAGGGQAGHGRRGRQQGAEGEIVGDREGMRRSKTGLRCDVVTLYQGGQYHLYTYKKYTDVRLVFAPETQIAFFGGDPDNFEYPRYDLDIAFFRVYENGKPRRGRALPEVAPNGARDGELVFVSGHPGRPTALNTVAAAGVPCATCVLSRRSSVLNRRTRRARASRSQRAPENARQAERRPVRHPEQPQGLQRPRSPGCRTRRSWRQEAAEEEPRVEGAARRAKQQYATVLGRRSPAVEAKRQRDLPATRRCRARHRARSSFGIARDARAPRRREAASRTASACASTATRQLPSLELRLFSPAPIYDEHRRGDADRRRWSGCVEELGADRSVVEEGARRQDARRRARTS